MKRRNTVLFAVLASLLLATMPTAVVGASSGELFVGDEQTTAQEFSNAATLQNLTVEGSGDAGSVVLDNVGGEIYDDFEDGDISEYSGATGKATVQTSVVQHGTYALKISNGQYGDGISSTSGLPAYPSKGDTFEVWMQPTQTDQNANFMWATQSTSEFPNGYGVQINPGRDMVQLSEAGGDGQLDNATVDIDSHLSEWWRVKVTWASDGQITAEFYDPTGTKVATLTGTGDAYSSGGITFRNGNKNNNQAPMYFDYAHSDEKNPETATFVSQPFEADRATSGVVNLTRLSNMDATVIWQHDDDGDGSWTSFTSTTHSAAGNYTASFASTHDRVRVRVELTRTSSNPAFELATTSVLWNPKPPTVDGASASPQNGSDVESADATLSVPVSDPDFGTQQGDSVTVDFYVDGSLTDTKTISSNQTVSTVAENLGPGNHTWHVETVDSYDGNTTSSTWSFEVNHYPASANGSAADPQGGVSFNDENLQVSVPVSDSDFADDTGDNVTVDLYVDGSQTASTTISSNQTVAFDVSDLADGAHDWHVEMSDSYGLTSTSSTWSFQVNHYAPVPDNAGAAPQDGAEKQTRTVTFTLPVNDTDFAETSGDDVQATFYLDGEQFATKNITANGSVSASTTISIGGPHEWHVELVDEYGNTNQTDADPSTSTNEPFAFSSPSKLRIYNESAPESLVDGVTVNIRFYGGADGGGFTVQRQTSDGVVNMTGLPTDQEFIVVAKADGYHNRRVYIESLYEQADVFLLPTSADSVYNVFKLEDKSGTYPPGETRLIIQRGLNRSGDFTWYTVSGDFFGGTNEHKTNLERNVRYRLIVENTRGDRRVIGAYMATDEQNPKLITISSIVVSPPEGQQYYATAWVNDEDPNTENNVTERPLRFTYSDPSNQTSSLDLVIHERGNESNVLVDLSTNDVGESFAYTYTLEGNETETGWVVDWSAERDGETVGEEFPVGSRGDVPLPMDPEWLARFGLVALPIIGALASERIATLGAMGVVAFAGVLMVTGIWPIPVVLWFAALITAVGAHALTMAQRGGVVG